MDLLVLNSSDKLQKKISELDYLLNGLKRKYDFVYDISVTKGKEKEKLFSVFPEYKMIYYAVIQSLIVDFNKVFNHKEDHSIYKIIKDYKSLKGIQRDNDNLLLFSKELKDYQEFIDQMIKARNKVSAHLDEETIDIKMEFETTFTLIKIAFNILNYIYQSSTLNNNSSIVPPTNYLNGTLSDFLLKSIRVK